MTLVARRRKHFRCFLVAQLPPNRCILVQQHSVASYQRCRHSVEPRTLTCPFKPSDLSAWSLLSRHPTHKCLLGRLCFVQVCRCSQPSRSRRPRLGLCQRKRFSQKRFRLKSTPKCTCTILHSLECMRTRQSRYETVGATRVIAATGLFYSARGTVPEF